MKGVTWIGAMYNIDDETITRIKTSFLLAFGANLICRPGITFNGEHLVVDFYVANRYQCSPERTSNHLSKLASIRRINGEFRKGA